ncbi:MAG TPA: hypothetical protein VJ817_03745 [Gemmatimonadales bacterium]|nr:hypothetical protein [Gemmatimonadales bacterium]
MNRHDRGLRKLVQEFLDGDRSFADFHEAFLSRWTRLPPRALTPAARERWNAVFALVLTTIPDPVTGEDAARGVIGEAELRARLLQHPVLAGPA